MGFESYLCPHIYDCRVVVGLVSVFGFQGGGGTDWSVIRFRDWDPDVDGYCREVGRP